MDQAVAAKTAERFHNYLQPIPSKKSLLVIEDDLSLIELIDTILAANNKAQDFDWEYVTSGEAALELIRRRGKFCGGDPYSLVITDIFLEGETTGFDVWLESQELYPNMPFVITSSLTTDRYLSILQGANNCPQYLPKPLTASRCQAIIQEYF